MWGSKYVQVNFILKVFVFLKRLFFKPTQLTPPERASSWRRRCWRFSRSVVCTNASSSTSTLAPRWTCCTTSSDTFITSAPVPEFIVKLPVKFKALNCIVPGETSWLAFLKDCPGRGANLGSYGLHLFTLSQAVSSALDHSATAPLNNLVAL